MPIDANKVNVDYIQNNGSELQLDFTNVPEAGALTGDEIVVLGGNEKTTTQDIADLGGGSSGYLSYVALLTQSGTDAPIATVLGNTLGGTVVWTRLGVGWYAGTLAGAFTLNKTWIPGCSEDRFAMYPISFNAINDYAYTLYPAGVDSIELQIFDATYQNVEFSTVFGGNALSLPEVKVYP
jgi:hypothetical protein